MCARTKRTFGKLVNCRDEVIGQVNDFKRDFVFNLVVKMQVRKIDDFLGNFGQLLLCQVEFSRFLGLLEVIINTPWRQRWKRWRFRWFPVFYSYCHRECVWPSVVCWNCAQEGRCNVTQEFVWNYNWCLKIAPDMSVWNSNLRLTSVLLAYRLINDDDFGKKKKALIFSIEDLILKTSL